MDEAQTFFERLVDATELKGLTDDREIPLKYWINLEGLNVAMVADDDNRIVHFEVNILGQDVRIARDSEFTDAQAVVLDAMLRDRGY